MAAPVGERTSYWARLSCLARVGLVGLSVVLGAALIITLNPSPVDLDKRTTVFAVLDALHALGVPETFQYVQLEFAANIVMFVPLGLFFALWVSPRWIMALAFPLLLSAAIELIQFVFLPARFADTSDLIANTVGGWIGVVIAGAITVGVRAAR